MGRGAPDGQVGLSIGAAKPRSWSFVRCDAPVPDAAQVTSRAGHTLVRDVVGFPHDVVLDDPGGALSEAAKLRLMKAFSLGVDRLRTAGRCQVARARIEIVVDPSVHGGPTLEPGPRVTLSPTLVRRMNRSMGHLRAAVFALCESRPDIVVEPRRAGRPATGPVPAKVLMFKNIFTKDVGGADALQINPGVHHLLSPLVAAGVDLVLLDGKLPLQDVCERPPLPDAPLSPAEFCTDPDELERALAAHPDLNLICLTLLERSFGQIRALCRFIRERSRAFIAIGGVFPTVTPEHAFVHLEQAQFLVRGDGEQVLPAIVELVAGRTIDQGLDDAAVEALSRLSGVLARAGRRSVAADCAVVNRVVNLDDAPLDFSLFERDNVEAGLSLSTSRGCVYSCHFCSVMDKNLWRGKSVAAVMDDLAAYDRRLVEIYGSAEAVPVTARRLQLWDDDFFLEPARAAELMRRMHAAGFRASFLQGTVSSFFVKEGRRVTRALNEELLDAIPSGFLVDRIGLKLGTENFNDRELKRLGKPYDYHRIRRLAFALSERGIRQEHFRILCNRETSLDDLLDNFEKLTELRWALGPDFFVLAPSWLINLYPTALYRSCQVRGTDLDQPTVGALRAEEFPEFDYPFVIPERPEHDEVFDIVSRFTGGMHFGVAGHPDWLFEGVHGPDDADYLLIYDYLRRVLEERQERLRASGAPQSAGELYRIERALASRLGPQRYVSRGALRRLAPALELESQEQARTQRLARYVMAIFDQARQAGQLEARVNVVAQPDGVVVEVSEGEEAVEFLVQRYLRDTPCAFHTSNLAFIARSSLSTEGERRRASPIIEQVRQAVSRHDNHELA